MSTRFTRSGTPLVESQSLALVQTARNLSDRLVELLASQLAQRGYREATPAALNFLGALECGDNHAAEIARRIGVSRQFVAREVRRFCALGYLQQRPGHGKQIIISFTDRGEQLMADARSLLAQIDDLIATGTSTSCVQDCVDLMQQIDTALRQSSWETGK